MGFRDFLTAWLIDPLAVAVLVLAAVLYLLGRARMGGMPDARPVGRTWAYLSGLLVVGLALLSPVSVYSDRLFFMHVFQHLLLTVVAVPLLLQGAPVGPLLWSLPASLRRRLERPLSPGSAAAGVFHRLTSPIVAASIYLLVFAAWYLPPLFDAAQGGAAAHHAAHLTLLLAAALFWWPVAYPTLGSSRLNHITAVMYLLVAAGLGGLIGGALTFLERPAYGTYTGVPRTWGISVVGDQQIGGAVMWAVGGLVYLSWAFVQLIRFLINEERAQAEAESRAAEQDPVDASESRV